MKFYFKLLPRLYISIIIEQMTNKVQTFDREKNAHSYCQMDPDKIIYGRVSFAV